jgi:hypothetical protein
MVKKEGDSTHTTASNDEKVPIADRWWIFENFV